MDGSEGVRIAGIPIPAGGAVDPLLARLVAELRAEGLRLVGFLQGRLPDGGMAVEDLAGGRLIGITQRLGPGSQGCRLDPQGLAEAAVLALHALDGGADLLVIPRFAKAEAEGQGFRAVIEKACAMQVPVLAAVRTDFAAAWDEFTGGLARPLPPEPQVILNWCRQAATA